jgi:hypothetical protein
MKYYRCHGLSSIASDRVRNIDDAARQFAHRFGVKLFGRAGRCLKLHRVGADKDTVWFRARIGTHTGPGQTLMFKVWRPA